MEIIENSLVLYRSRPARVARAGDRIEIELENGDIRRVRAKDVSPLHPGPFQSFAELSPQEGDVETARELLAGEPTTLPELAELIFGENSPATAWAAWELVADGVHFHGEPGDIHARSAAEVKQQQQTREAKQAQARAFGEFLERARAGQRAPGDETFLKDVEDQAYGRREKSRALAELARQQTRENAHALLLGLGYWDEMVNPYPARMGVSVDPPGAAIPELPDEDRLDLTGLPAFAIDDEGATDPDDAVSVDGERIWVHVADVAALVGPGSEADIEARGRGANLYLPEGTVHMLPDRATQTLGLGLSEVSPALSIGFTLSQSGEIADTAVAPSLVRVTRLTYEQAEERLDDEPLARMRRLADAFRRRRIAQGAATIALPEVKIRVVDGEVAITPLPRLRSREMVTDFMLMAGEAAAMYAIERGISFPFTTQAPPETDERPEGMAAMFAFRKRLKRSQMKSAPGKHAGLGLPVYAQVTSPLRRYLDLVAHQQLRASLRGAEPLGEEEMMDRVGAAEAVRGAVRAAERLSNKHWTLVYLMRHPGWAGEGALVERRGQRGVVTIPPLGLETRVNLPSGAELDSLVTLKLTDLDLPELTVYFESQR